MGYQLETPIFSSSRAMSSGRSQRASWLRATAPLVIDLQTSSTTLAKTEPLTEGTDGMDLPPEMLSADGLCCLSRARWVAGADAALPERRFEGRSTRGARPPALPGAP